MNTLVVSHIVEKVDCKVLARRCVDISVDRAIAEKIACGGSFIKKNIIIKTP